jgi:2,3,4,5-tetrahydropyridine-2-carboxylate N-succinyltransferase
MSTNGCSIDIDLASLEGRINALFDEDRRGRSDETDQLLRDFRRTLNAGVARVAMPDTIDAPRPPNTDGGEVVRRGWTINLWVKRGILLHHMLGKLGPTPDDPLSFELDTLPRRRFQASDGVRIPSAGCYVRDGAYLAPGVTCLPPVFVGNGAYIDEGTVLDSHTSVGLCAQLGKRARLNAGAKIGGLIEPFHAMPNIVCDDVILGSDSGIFDGGYMGEGSILTVGVRVTRNSRIFDPAKKVLLKAAPGQPLVIPPLAIVVPAVQPVTKGPMARSGLQIGSLVIAGYRDDASLSDDFLASLIE